MGEYISVLTRSLPPNSILINSVVGPELNIELVNNTTASTDTARKLWSLGALTWWWAQNTKYVEIEFFLLYVIKVQDRLFYLSLRLYPIHHD